MPKISPILCLMATLPKISAELTDYSPYVERLPVSAETWAPKERRGERIKTQFESDVILLTRTLFPTFEGAKRVNGTERYEETLEKAEVLARFLIAIRVAGLRLITAKHKLEGSKGIAWPYPLAAALGHGQRILTVLKGVDGERFLSFLFGGAGGRYPDFVKRRTISSHGVRLSPNGEVEEIKVNDAKGIAANFLKGFKGQHLYINHSWGGIGEIGPDGLLNGVSGKRHDPKTGKTDDATKLGHLYVFYENLAPELSAILFGVETCAPASKNPYGVSHNLRSGLKDLTENRPVNGGSKMSVLLPPELAPAIHGGMELTVTPAIAREIAETWARYQAMPPWLKVEFMVNLLSENGEGSPPYIPTDRRELAYRGD